MIGHLWPFPFVGWLVMLGDRLLASRYEAIYYALLLIWIYFGVGGVHQMSLSDAPERRSPGPRGQSTADLDEASVFIPSATVCNFFVKYFAGAGTWAEIPLRLASSHPIVWITGVAFAVLSAGRRPPSQPLYARCLDWHLLPGGLCETTSEIIIHLRREAVR